MAACLPFHRGTAGRFNFFANFSNLMSLFRPQCCCKEVEGLFRRIKSTDNTMLKKTGQIGKAACIYPEIGCAFRHLATN